MIEDGEIETLHKPALDYVRNTLGLEVVYHRPDKRSGLESGWPDFTILDPKRSLLVEFKLEKEPLSPNQKKVHARLKSKGYPVHVVKSYPVFVELVSAWHAGLQTEPAELAPDRSRLRQHQGWVYIPQETRSNSYFKKRKCGPGDMALPPLFGP